MDAQEAMRSVRKGAVHFFSGTSLSRISGLGRDLAMAFFFGSQPAIAAFMVAYRLANLFRRLLGDGPLAQGFIPHFETARLADAKEGARFFRDVLFSLMFLVIVVVVIGEVGIFCSGSSEQGILRLTGLMLPSLLFICLYGVFGALLQCERKLFLFSVAPVLCNVVWIGAVLLYREQIPDRVAVALSIAVVVGFFLQWVLLVPSAVSYLRQHLSWGEILSFRLFPLPVWRAIKAISMTLIGVGAVQINGALDSLFARMASPEGPAYLWYAIRIEQLPVGLIGVALSSALLPPLSKALIAGQVEHFSTLLQFALRKCCLFMIPCTVALFVLAYPGVNLLYGRGDFSLDAVQETVYCLWGYGAGLLPAVAVLLLAAGFYAQKNLKTPVIASVIAVAVNVGLNALFVCVFDWGSFSVALATSVGAWLNCFLLVVALCRRGLWGMGEWRDLYKITGGSLLAGGITLALGFLGNLYEISRGFGDQVLRMGILGSLFLMQAFIYTRAVFKNTALKI